MRDHVIVSSRRPVADPMDAFVSMIGEERFAEFMRRKIGTHGKIPKNRAADLMHERSNYRPVLKFLRENGPATTRQIAAALNERINTATARLCALRQNGYVTSGKVPEMNGKPTVWTLVDVEGMAV